MIAQTRLSSVWHVVGCTALACLAAMMPTAAHGQERGFPTFLYLCDGTTFEGWEQQSGQDSPWSVADSRLRGNEKSGRLSADHTFGWVVWKFQWTGAPGSVLNVDLDEAPTGKPISIEFKNDGPSGRILQGDQELASGVAVELEPYGQVVEIAVDGGYLVVKVNDREVSRAFISAGRRSGFALRVTKGNADISSILFRELGGRPLFDGKSLTGFYTDGNPDAWEVKDNSIHALGKKGNYLRSQELFGNFTLSLDYRIAEGGNSGIGIRTPVDAWPSRDGMEIQIFDQPQDAPIGPETNAGIYRNVAPFRKNTVPYPEWNHLVIKADGPMLSVWINGRLVNHANVQRHPVLRHRGRSGWIGLQDHGSPTEFRNLVVIDAPEGDGFPGWTESGHSTPIEQVLGPALDPAVLMEQRSIKPAVVTGTNPGGNDRGGELLKIQGPGALTRIFRTNASGSLAFYFDDETEPRIESSWFNLPEKLSLIASSKTTLYTYLPFQKSLRIVQTGSRPAEYQFAYVRFPQGDGSSSQPGNGRAWFGALDYMKQHHEHGTLPIEPHLTKSTTGPQTLKPGESAVLVEASGSGQTRWMRLFPKRDDLLANRGLWLDVFVDGADRPSVSAPARLLYAALAPENGQRPGGNLAMTQRDNGYFSLLPIPFTNGLKIVGRNTGQTPLADVGAEVAIDRLPAGDVPAARLRSIYQESPVDAQSPWLDIDVNGRLVSITVESPSQELGKISRLLIDGIPQDPYKETKVAALLGRDTPASDQNSALDGAAGPLCWRYFLIDGPAFGSSLRVERSDGRPDPVLLLYYAIF